MAKFGKSRFPKSYQKRVGKNARKLLHDNSIELASILEQYDVISDNISIFEMGAGGCRNLYYIWKKNNSVILYANDLFEAESKKQMESEIKNNLTFYEGDSEKIFNKCRVNDLDLLVVSDHFMHLQYDKVDNIITKVLDDWTPNYILLREVKKQFENKKHPRLFHNYNRFLSKYDLIHESDSKQTDEYFIWLLNRKK